MSTTTTSSSFFSLDENKAVIRRFASVIQGLEPLKSPHPEVVGPLRRFISILESNLEAFDQYCPLNINWIGKRYIDQLKTFDGARDEDFAEKLIDIFTNSYRFLCELEFAQLGELSFELLTIKSFVDKNLERFDHEFRRQIVFANYLLPAQVAKSLIQNPSLADYRAFASTATEAKKLKVAWDTELNEKKAEIEGLRKSIDSIKTQYNFVGLVKGFETLADGKKTERNRSFLSLLAIGAAMLGTLVAEIIYVLQDPEFIHSRKESLLFTVPAIVTIELILFYFFRVVLTRYRGLQAQLLQLELRISLCQFIQSYTEYSVKIKKADPGALEKFESLIFSNVIPDAERLPATFDGIQQLADLIKSVRGQ